MSSGKHSALGSTLFVYSLIMIAAGVAGAFVGKWQRTEGGLGGGLFDIILTPAYFASAAIPLTVAAAFISGHRRPGPLAAYAGVGQAVVTLTFVVLAFVYTFNVREMGQIPGYGWPALVGAALMGTTTMAAASAATAYGVGAITQRAFHAESDAAPAEPAVRVVPVEEPRRNQKALEIAQERLARGEITAHDYEHMMKLIR